MTLRSSPRTCPTFRNLLAKGFCADDVAEGGAAEDGDGNRNFEDDVDGTGMGEGDGKKDVSDEIEDEEQILGLEGEEEMEKNEDQVYLWWWSEPAARSGTRAQGGGRTSTQWTCTHASAARTHARMRHAPCTIPMLTRASRSLSLSAVAFRHAFRPTVKAGAGRGGGRHRTRDGERVRRRYVRRARS